MCRNVVLLLVLILLPPLSAYAEPQSLDDKAQSGQSLLRAGDYEQARELFREGLQEARQANDKDWIARFSFYEGNVNLIEAGANNAAISELAIQAVRNYRVALELRPESGSAMVNLARAMTLLGKDSQADAWYQRAIRLGDKKQALYRKQYAEFLEQRDPVEATNQLREVVAAQPKSVKAHRQLVKTYMDPNYASRLPEYLHQQVQKGDVLRAQEAALSALADPDWPAEHKGDLMTVVGASLARQHVTPAQFADSEAENALRKIAATNPALRQCIGELFQTLGRRPQRVDYSWWTADRERTDTLSQLLRSLARSSAQSGATRRAETLYRNAVELKGANDPIALRELVDFYSERGDMRSIKAISNRYEFQLFSGKQMAYESGDDQAIYDYHRTLASIYANQALQTGDWGSPNKATSAAFQLEHAYGTATRSGSITPDTQLVDQLAQSYEATVGKTAANNVRLEAAANYNRAGDKAAAARVLQPIDATILSAPERSEYDRLIKLETVRPGDQLSPADPSPNATGRQLLQRLPNVAGDPALATPSESLKESNVGTAGKKDSP